MAETVSMEIIARIVSDFPTKFGVPRQSGMSDALKATVVFEPEYRVAEAENTASPEAGEVCTLTLRGRI